MRVDVDGLDVQIGGTRPVSDVDLTVSPGHFVGLVEPNGSGMSTLLRALYRALRPTHGAVRLDERDVWRALSARQSAQRTAVVAQESASDFDIGVIEVAASGRTPHKGLVDRDTAHDRDLVEHFARAGGSNSPGRTALRHPVVEDVLTPHLLAQVFGVQAHCDRRPLTGRLQLAFAPLSSRPTSSQNGTPCP